MRAGKRVNVGAGRGIGVPRCARRPFASFSEDRGGLTFRRTLTSIGSRLNGSCPLMVKNRYVAARRGVSSVGPTGGGRIVKDISGTGGRLTRGTVRTTLASFKA